MSLSAKLFIFIFSFWILGTIVCSVTDDANMQVTEMQGTVDSVINIDPTSLTWYNQVGKVLFWDYSIFENPDGTHSDWAYIKYIFLYPLSAAVLISIAFVILPALISVVGSIFRWR